MPEVYARCFSARSEGDSQSLEKGLLRALQNWVGERWPTGEEWFAPGAPRRFLSADGSIFRWEPFQHEDEILLEFTWRHAHVDDPDITWATQVSAVGAANDCRISVRVWNTGPDFEEEGALPTTRPRLIRHLCEHFDLSTAGFRLRGEPRVLKPDEIQTFVRYELLDPARSAPIALLTKDDSGQWLVDPRSLTDEWLSLAEMVALPSREASFRLTGELEDKALSCFSGAARIYLPGFSKDDNPFRHPLLLPRRLADKDHRMRIAMTMARMSVSSYTPIEGLQALRDHRAVEYDRRTEELAEGLRKAAEEGAGSATWEALALEYDADNQRLKAAIEQLREQLVEEEHKVRGLRFQLQQVRRAVGGETDASDIEFEPQSLADAVEFAQAAFEDDLRVLDTAVKSARQSTFQRPDEVYNALRELATVSGRAREKPLGKNLKDVFAELGLTYKAGITASSSKAIRDQHRFVDGSETFECTEHLVFGTAYDKTLCARIYFTTEADGQGRWVVGHVGEHLDTPRTN